MGRSLLGIFLAVLVFAGSPLVSPSVGQEIRFTVAAGPATPVDRRLFGHFLERASWGEPGPEGALLPGTHDLDPRVLESLKAMRISIIRFPGGTDVDYIDWRDMVSNVPGREGADRPVTVGHTGKPIMNRFGLDEYFRLRDALGCETILVTNLLDAVSKKRPLREAALLAAGLVAYCNAPVGATLPEGMPDWPAVRAKNGHPAPYGAQFFQIGNEWWGFRDRALKAAGIADPKQAGAWYAECLRAYLDLMRAADPKIEFILDGAGPGDPLMAAVLEDPAVRRAVRYVTFHSYAPGLMSSLKRDGQPYPFDKIGAEELWQAWVAMPGSFDGDGRNVAFGSQIGYARGLGYRIVCTEWNWNGWGFERIQPRPQIEPAAAKAIGAAGFLHGLMRSGEAIDLACQSNLIGCGWGIGCVQVSRDGSGPPHYSPTGQVTMFYALHHGDRLLPVRAENVPTFAQPYEVGWTRGKAKVAFLDAVATADARTLYFHAVNRHMSRSFDVTVDLGGLGGLDRRAVHHLMEGRLKEKPAPGEAAEVMSVGRRPLELNGRTLAVTLPARSISCIEIPLKP
jgi:alpha-N-arabinofuranosidase